MLEYIERAQSYVAGMTFEQFVADRKTVDAVVLTLHVIGEAARNVPSDIQAKYPDIEWVDVISMRHKIAHGYFLVDFNIIWRVVGDPLSRLKVGLQRIPIDQS